MTELVAWSTTAVNLPEHAENAIHTDAGARAAGFPGALVAGATVYAYLTHVPTAAWGHEWLAGGGAHVRFSVPVLNGETVDCVPADASDSENGALPVDARVGGVRRAACSVTKVGALPPRCTGEGESLEPISFVADATWSDYGTRAGDDLPLYAEQDLLHPASWMRVANQFFHEQLVSGPWIHVRSNLRHHGIAHVGATIDATATVIERFDSRAGHRAIADIRIHAEGERVATYEHEAIIELPS